MRIQFDTSQIVLLASAIDASKVRVGANTATAVRKTAADIERDAKAFAPVDTGNLRNSISTSITGDGRYSSMTAEIGPTAEYGVYQELGTSVMGPQPYLAPAFDRNIGGLQGALGATVQL